MILLLADAKWGHTTRYSGVPRGASCDHSNNLRYAGGIVVLQGGVVAAALAFTPVVARLADAAPALQSPVPVAAERALLHLHR